VAELRESRKGGVVKQISRVEKKLKSKQSLKGQTTLKSRKSSKRRDKTQNNSIFSVSDASKAEAGPDKNSHYIEYFEGLNKEVIER